MIYYDFHIHSCLSPCADDDMTPHNIAGMGYIKGLGAMALTDHNTCKNCPAFFAACERFGIVPIAGVELSTSEDVHLVCLFPTLEAALMFDKELDKHRAKIDNRPERFGSQIIMDENDSVAGEFDKLLIAATDLWMGDAVSLARSFGAAVYPAHIDREANGIITMLGDVPSEYGFDCVEFREIKNLDAYFSSYPSINGKKVLVSSDAHTLGDISEAENALEIPENITEINKIREKIFAYISKS
ncbi:MAG: PHP domain-containing protein [Ruminococcaceae bacterium]|nr:PHP domain-containing protein [Oscillospiraceae bacterium]